ncbi:exo-1,3-beta-glucanase [Flagelloscypha sp. PMI_526]|nr:exo-1,3-beta-glucanase [Flagelloscypha sp. PMI_526]
MVNAVRLPSLVLAVAGLVNAISPGFPYGTQKVRGHTSFLTIPLRGWLVLEPWITPDLFDATGDSRIIDEYTFGQYQNKATAKAALTQHWDTWITESDFAQIAAAGLNHVRLPIGYWAWDVSGGEPFIQGQLPYLDKAVTWAAAHNLKVIVDLHGAPGSQNGYDNSGQKRDHPYWQTSQSNIARTNTIIKTLANKFKDQTGVVSVIQALNEPAGWYGNGIMDTIRQFFYDSYGNVRYPYGSSRQSNTVLMLHDAFQDLSTWNGFMRPPNWEGVIMDTHQYTMFTLDQIARSDSQKIQAACNLGPTISNFSQNQLWTVVGEWTPAGDDCAKYLNGRGTGNRYEGTYPGSTRIGSCSGRTGDASTFSASYKDFLAKYWSAQIHAYEQGIGWIQWTWKTQAQEWSYHSGLKYGWIPQNPTQPKYPNICG